MVLAPSPLLQRITPPEFVGKLAGPLGGFLTLYGEAPLLCIDLGQGAAHELEAGLAGSSDPDAQVSTQTLGFHTVMADDGASGSQASHGFSAAALGSRLARGRHFVLPLVKRAQETMSMERISVGRARNKDVVLRDGSVSKFHAWFEVGEGGSVQLADAGSKNGTTLAGEALPARTLTPLPYGEGVKFGNVAAFVCEPAVLWEAFHKR